eukprot:7376859-Prymnesium_polylepis.3
MIKTARRAPSTGGRSFSPAGGDGGALFQAEAARPMARGNPLGPAGHAIPLALRFFVLPAPNLAW